MNEQKRMKKQLYKNMLYIYIVFIILFLFFDFVVYNNVSSSMYKSIDKQINAEVERFSKKNEPIPEEIEKRENEVKPEVGENDKERIIGPRFQDVDPRLICIIRDEQGNIINQNSIGRIYDNYLADVEFDKNNVQNTYMIEVGNHYNYRGITVINYDDNGDLNYIQFLANVDGEIQSLQNLKVTLIIGTIAIVGISIIASYILSRRALNPIITSWKKQTEFVQNASHELRTPLTIIQAKEELLLQTPNEKIIDKSEDINIALNETRRLSKLIKDLMVLARADSNEVVLDKKSTDVDSMIKEILTPYIEFAEIEEKKVQMELGYGKNIYIDADKISQLMVIILDNSIKYTTKGDSINIKTYNKDNKFVLEVADTGIGITKDGIKHAFDRFYREDKARSRESGGSGLGLAIAYMITQLHGGNIRIMKNEPKGTKVIVKI